MTQEEKQLLFSDLCARQPYSVMINTPLFEKPTLLKGIADNMCWAVVDENNYEWVDIDDVKPYLRPMDSMTDEERDEYENILEYDRNYYYTTSTPTIKTIDWLNENHFDYRKLIEKELALEAPKDMY